MLERITLHDFQPHERTTIELDPFATMIVGDNDQGKTAIIRALRWLALNATPRRGNFQREGAENHRVKLTIDGRTIVRFRDKSKNLYYLDGEVYKAIGAAVPEEIAKLLNVADVNFQSQLDSPFWFSESAPDVSKNLNAIVDLQIIDDTQSNLAGELRKARIEVGLLETQTERAAQERESLRWVLDFGEDVRKVTEAHERWKATVDENEVLSAIIERIEECQTTIDRLHKQAKLPSVKHLEQLCERHAKTRQIRYELETMILEIEKATATRDEAYRTHTEKMDELRRLTKGKCPVCGTPIPSL